MAKVISPGFIDVALEIERTGDPDNYVITFGGRIAVPPFTQTNAESLANMLGSTLDDVLHNTERMVGLNVRVGQDGAPLVRQVTMDKTGLGSGVVLPPNVAVVVNKLTALGGRRNRGRLFWPSIPEGDVDSLGLISIARRDAYQVVFDALLSNLEGGGGFSQNTDAMVIFHTLPPATPTVVESLRVERLVGTQRRRLRR